MVKLKFKVFEFLVKSARWQFLAKTEKEIYFISNVRNYSTYNEEGFIAINETSGHVEIVSFEEVKNSFPAKKTFVSGNPVKPSVFRIIDKPFQINKNRKVIYITGGSLGSHSINLHIKKIIIPLLNKYIVIHQAGDTKEYHDFEDLSVIKKDLPKELQSRYFLVKHFFDNEIGYIYSKADLVIGRAGANTFFELLALNKPALFIPLPWSSGREQQHHAEIFAKSGCGEIFHQITPSEKLLRLINQMIEKIDYYKGNFKYLSKFYKKNVSKYLIDEIFNQT